MKRVRPESSHLPALKYVDAHHEPRSPATLGVEANGCLHCPDEPCMSFSETTGIDGQITRVCPTDAIRDVRSEPGPTITDDCIGCGICVMRCPVGALSLSEAGRAVATAAKESETQAAVGDIDFSMSRAAQSATAEFADAEWREIFSRLSTSCYELSQSSFYPLVARLFTAAGIPAYLPPRGDTNNRIDLVLVDSTNSLPVEIKSATETPIINVKSIQQALENRIVLDERKFFPTVVGGATLVVGFAYPPPRSDVAELIDDVNRAFGIRVGIISIPDLYEMALQHQFLRSPPRRKELAELVGPLS